MLPPKQSSNQPRMSNFKDILKRWQVIVHCSSNSNDLNSEQPLTNHIRSLIHKIPADRLKLPFPNAIIA
ncbi:unnamed protein product [Gongylonema pulchrum]|uniref:Uncharacterized protein n=1 Tax=Gongylonema pulchrum TaxID=637853 RepID=A0A3P6SSR2_9BILA|nr:unnamed protein product [Gongylonema pulchrum]